MTWRVKNILIFKELKDGVGFALNDF